MYIGYMSIWLNRYNDIYILGYVHYGYMDKCMNGRMNI